MKKKLPRNHDFSNINRNDNSEGPTKNFSLIFIVNNIRYFRLISLPHHLSADLIWFFNRTPIQNFIGEIRQLQLLMPTADHCSGCLDLLLQHHCAQQLRTSVISVNKLQPLSVKLFLTPKTFEVSHHRHFSNCFNYLIINFIDRYNFYKSLLKIQFKILNGFIFPLGEKEDAKPSLVKV